MSETLLEKVINSMKKNHFYNEICANNENFSEISKSIIAIDFL